MTRTYPELGQLIGELVERKQEQYGDAFGRAGAVLREMYPDGIRPEQYDDLLAIVRIIDKLFRVATRATSERESPGIDIAGYGLLIAQRDERRG